MKSKHLLGLCIAILFFAACRKENSTIEPPIEKPEGTEIIRDSVSYTLDGKLYTAVTYSSGWRVGNGQANAKVDSIVKNTYYISGNKDSVLYSKHYGIQNDQQRIEVIFIKKFNRNMMTNGLLFQPKNPKDFYAIGSRNYALDFERDNSQNGIAIRINNQGSFKTYGLDSFRIPPVLNTDAQKNSKFEITSVKKSKSGLYILEAKFNATVFDAEYRVSKTIDNGYFRINLGLLDEYYK